MMTCVEKLRKDHPEMNEFDIGYTVGNKCPSEFGYPEDPTCNIDCSDCWKREIPESAAEGLIEGFNTSNPEIVQAVNIMTGSIKDSGSTTEFDTGAHRDARDGKGRCDLLALEVVANFICEDDDKTDWVLWSLREFQKDGCTCHLYSALESFNVRCYDNCYTMMLEVAKHYEAGAAKYGADNWRRGMPTYIYIDSAIRHYLKWLRGDKDENHDRAFVWNLMCCIWEVDYHKGHEETK